MLLEDLGLEAGGSQLLEDRTPIQVKVDNSASIIFQSKMNTDSKLKGVFDLRWQWVRDLQNTEQVQAVKVHTDNNLADILTKCMSRTLYEGLISQQKQITIGQANDTTSTISKQ